MQIDIHSGPYATIEEAREALERIERCYSPFAYGTRVRIEEVPEARDTYVVKGYRYSSAD